ncbi:MAG: hypothetical protein U0575_16205 [Phycisphaerales bacterium]
MPRAKRRRVLRRRGPFTGRRDASINWHAHRCFDLLSHLDHAVRRDPEVRDGRLRVAGHEREEPLSPEREAVLVRARHERLAAEEEGRLVGLDAQSERLARLEDRRHIRFLHEAVARRHDVEAVGPLLDLDSLLDRHVGDLLELDREHDDAPVEHLVVQQVVQERERHALGIARHEDGGARDARRRVVVDRLHEDRQRAHALAQPLADEGAPSLPRRQKREDERGDGEREPSALRDLGQVGAEEGEVDEEERAGDERHQRLRPAPALPRDGGEEDRGDRHRSGDRDAVRGCEIARASEADHESDRRQHQRPVDRPDEDLPVLVRRGVLDLEPRAVAELDGLHREREDAGDERLRGDHGRGGGEPHQRDDGPSRRERVERVPVRRVVEQQRALAEVVQQQRHEDQPEPRDADGTQSEVAHVGIERLAAGHDQEDRAEHEIAVKSVRREEVDAVDGIECREHVRVSRDREDAQRGDGDEPDDHHRSEDGADPRGSGRLHGEEPDQDGDRQGNHPVLEPRRRHGDALDGAEHRDRRGDRAVAVEQGGAEDAQQREHADPTPDRLAAVRFSRGRLMSASSARIPPSPRLSARMMNPRYLTPTTSTSDQTISDMTPSTLLRVASTACSPLKHSRTA